MTDEHVAQNRWIDAAVVAGVPVDDVTMEETIGLIDGFIEQGRSSGRTFQIATVNVDFVVNAQRDPDVMDILRRAELCLPDGMPVVWHARLSGIALRDRVAGADLVPALVERSVTTGWRVLLFGSKEGVAESAAALLTERCPGAIVTGISGPMLADPRSMDQSWIDEMIEFAPDIVCVALGNPKQERWIDAHREVVGASVLIGVGGTLDFLVGGRKRAPEWMGRYGLEWLFRAAQEPGRLGRRYAHDAVVFGPHIARAAWRRLRSRRARSALEIVTDDAGNVSAVRIADRPLTAADIGRLTGVSRSGWRLGVRIPVTGGVSRALVVDPDLDVHGRFDAA